MSSAAISIATPATTSAATTPAQDIAHALSILEHDIRELMKHYYELSSQVVIAKQSSEPDDAELINDLEFRMSRDLADAKCFHEIRLEILLAQEENDA